MASIQKCSRRTELKDSLKAVGFLWMLLFTTSLLAIVFFFSTKGYIINTSPSLPLGIYRTMPITEPLEVGDMVEVQIPKELFAIMQERGYKKKKAMVKVGTLLKIIQGKEGDVFSLEETKVGKRIVKNGTTVLGIAFLQDRQGRAFITPKEWKVGKGEYFLMGEHPRSYDSRYFGPIKAEYITRKACPVWTWKGES